MAFWLASKREGQDTDFIQRFDPRFWTVDFPRPMMASVVATAPDALRVECEFHNRDALAGLIWESEDRFDHPLLSYDTSRDYRRLSLAFRWKSAGVMPLDALHGPTLTIEGRDTSGAPRIWYVRIWNYAVGSPTDARVTLPFSDLREGWTADGDPVHVADIDRMFLSIVPPDHDPVDSQLLSARADGWVEMSAISASGERAMLPIGDAMLPPHEVGMCTAYDDSYNLTPARMLRNLLHLGYRDTYIHYVGMSHYFRLLPAGGDALHVDPEVPLCAPCIAWHENLFAESLALDLTPIVSLSFELFNEHCPENWKQRDWNGAPALTGWVPPSTLLSPVNDDAVLYLRMVAQAFVELQMAAELDVHFQIGEPWWWVNADGKPCVYDDAVRDAYADPPEITDLTIDPGWPDRGFLNWLGSWLAIGVRKVRDQVQSVSGNTAITHLLMFTPTIFDPARPAITRMNTNYRFAHDNYDVLQIEDYDWLTAGAEALRKSAYAVVDAELGYPQDEQHYLGGFILDPADAEESWPLIDAGIDEAIKRGVARTFVWALPQVLRDGYVRLSAEEAELQAIDDVRYPLALGRDASVSPEFSTTIALTASGHERRNSQWSDARLHFDVGPGIRSQAELGVLLEFYRARRGPARGFLLEDPYDFSSAGLTGTPTPVDQLVAVGDGLAATFQLVKRYGTINDPQVRPITRPRPGTVVVSIDGAEVTDWSLETTGRIVFQEAPAAGAEIRAGFLFDVPVRFAEDRIDISGATFAAGDAPSVPLIELREDV